jgi:GDP-4-dehydro-6-deoxy-D-mannose reductase
MRVAVTGADGFVGRHVCARLESRGDRVLGLAGPPSGIDITDERALEATLDSFGPEGVIHLAGVSSVARSHAEPLETFRINVLGGVALCTVLQKVAPKARVLIVGSGEVYGETPTGDSRTSEASPLLPTSPYAASKAAAEVAAFQFHRAYGLWVVAARSFNHLGRGQAPSFAVPSFARQLEAMRARGEPGILSVGNLEPVRDFSHVLDVVEAYLVLLERGIAGEAYNVASGVGRSMQSIVEELVALSGAKARIVVDPARVRPVEIPRLVGDPTKLRTLGWEPKYDVRRALQDALGEARSS